MKKNLGSFVWWMITAIIIIGFTLCFLGFLHHDQISLIVGILDIGLVWILVSIKNEIGA